MLKYVQEVCARVAALQAQGDVSTALGLLRALLVVLRAQPTQHVFGSSQEGVLCRQLLGEAVVLLAIAHLQEGSVAAADSLLSLLGFRHRLAAAAFLPPGQQPAALPGPAQGPRLPQSSHAPLLDGHAGAESLEGTAPRAACVKSALGGALASVAVAQQPAGERQQQGQQQATATTSMSRPRARPPASPPLVLDHALPPAVLASLQQGFRPSAAFWREHGYWEEAGSGFFSYVFPLSDPPQHPVEHAIAHLRQQQLCLVAGEDEGSMCCGPGDSAGVQQENRTGAAAVDASINEAGREVSDASPALPTTPPHGSCRSKGDSGSRSGQEILIKGSSNDGTICSGWERELAGRVGRASHAEWWVHCRGPADPHQLHFDVDETCLRRGRPHYALRHPLLGSLLFLEGCPAHHGSTLILDQIPKDEALTERGWLVQPAPGRYAAFRGDLLHGVMPGARDGCSQPRITLMVAWWEFDEEQQQQLAQQAPEWAQRANLPGEAQGPAGSAAGCSWPGEFTTVMSEASLAKQRQQQQQPAEQVQQPVHQERVLAASSAQLGGLGALQPAAQAPDAAAAFLIEPVWEAVCSGHSSTAVDTQTQEASVQDQSVPAVDVATRPVHASSDDSARGPVQPSRAGDAEEAHASKHARHGGGETGGDHEAARLPLLYPPLRFFLVDAADIRAAYIPSDGADHPQTGDMFESLHLPSCDTMLGD
ncbi:hypothetical protein N2152v2_009712 [Parachlorella kessleri]